MDKTIENKSAYQKPSSSKPSTKLSAIKIIKALTTNRKSPKENKVKGMVRAMRIGLTNTLSSDSTKESNKAEV